MRTLLMTLFVGFLINLAWTKGLHYFLTTYYDTQTYYQIYNKFEGFTTPIIVSVFLAVWAFFVWANYRRESKVNKGIESL